tara:strand:+ start:501 stop:662 length:162 start_codon:yes stop_codon:yes gene_type:complete
MNSFLSVFIQVLIYVTLGGLLVEFAGANMTMWMLTIILIQTVANQDKIKELEK